MGTKKLQVYEIILPSYSVPSIRCLSYIKKLEFSLQHIADTFRDLAVAIMKSYPELKKNRSNS